MKGALNNLHVNLSCFMAGSSATKRYNIVHGGRNMSDPFAQYVGSRTLEIVGRSTV